VVSTPALGKAMAEKLGQSEAVLLWGHGIALGASSLPEAISRVDELRDSAQLQQATIAMGGAWKPQPLTADGSMAERTWAYYRREVLEETGGEVPRSPEATPERPSGPDQAAAHDVVLANRILASEDLGMGILDTLGHVSVRNVRNPSAYFIAPGVAPAAVTHGDVVQRDATKSEPDTLGLSIHGEIYRARPDVNAVLYARTPEIVAFTAGAAALRPVVNGGAFIGNGLPVFSMVSLGGEQPSLANPAFGRGVAQALGKAAGVLLARNGFVLTGRSIYNLVDQAYQLRLNAIIQRQTIALRGKVSYLNERPAEPVGQNEPQQPAPTGPPEGRSWVYWSQNVSLE
jgi:ribulose-5-phosphate 4-epimerase/fuculose-1-phosphate aldolase